MVESDDKLAKAIAWLVETLGPPGIAGVSDIVGKVIETIGRIAEGIATNPDPISQGVSIALVIVTIDFFLTTEPYKTLLHKLKLDAWLGTLLTHFSKIIPAPPLIPLNSLSQQTGKPSVDPFGNPITTPPDTAFPYGVTFTYVNIFDVSKNLQGQEWFKTAAEREAWITQNANRITVTARQNPP